LIVKRRLSPAFVSIDATHVVSDTDAGELACVLGTVRRPS
jgi:hypothetical protein